MKTSKILGEHQGIWFHTIGQRKGLGLGGGSWFVVDKNIEENAIFVSHGYDPISQYKNEISLDDFQFITETVEQKEIDITFKIRHTPEFIKGRIIQKANAQVSIKSEKAISGVAPGQFGVVYDKDKNCCLGSGVIGIV